MANTKKQPDKPTATTKQKEYEFTSEEVAIAEREVQRRNLPNTRIIIKDGNSLTYEHVEPYIGQLALMEAIGSNDLDFFVQFMNQVGNAVTQGQSLQEEEINFAMSVIKGIEPQDQIEAMLGAQMASVHMASMKFARRLNHVENIQQQDSAEKTFNKLNRTFIAQMAALKKYRTGGEQKVKVEHVHVHEGGQAVVGDINQTTNHGGPNEKS